MKKAILSLALLAVTLGACNTIEGLGQDVQATGEGVSKAAVKTKDKIK